ncbi:MAG: alpha/beta hydrolase [Pseudomonadota bacterium]
MKKQIVTVLAFSLLGLRAVFAQELVPLFELETLAERDPAAALPQVEAALQSELATADLRTAFDLTSLRVAVLTGLGRPEDAAITAAMLAGSALSHRDLLRIDPAPFLQDAAERAQALGAFEDAFDLYEALLAEMIDGARADREIADVLRQLAQLAREIGDEAVAEAYEARIAGLRLTAPQTPNFAGAAQIAAQNPYGLRGKTGGFATMDVFYATDRERTGKTAPTSFYGAGRGPLEVGIATVTVPHSHTPGVLEAPAIYRLEFRPNPTKHVVLQSVVPVEADAFFNRMRASFADRPEREALLFVHGYNVNFANAARRAAQLAYDMRYPGLPILYSWPSRGRTTGYVADTAAVRLSARRLTHFLDDIVAQSGADVIHLVAHSMGNRALTDALELMALRRGVKAGDTPVFGQIVYAAPDVDAGLFRAMMPTIAPLAQRMTLYASEQDWALSVSRRLHGNVPRAGIGGADTLSDERVDSIDMSQLGEDMLAHSYFADDTSAIADMMTLLWQNASPNRRCGLQQQAADASVWLYQSGVCADRNLVELLAHMRAAKAQTPAEATALLREKVEDAELAATLAPVLENMLSD